MVMRMLSLITTIVLVAACGGKMPEPDPIPAATISFNPGTLIVSPEGGEASVRVQATAVWTVETDGQGWYSLASSSQVYRGESILKVTAEPNVSGNARKGSIRFTSDGNSRNSVSP